jgi:hypothetical protein
MSHLNWLAVVAAAVSTFVIGGLWYSPALFGRAWMSANNFTQEDLSKSNMAKIFGLSFIFALLMSQIWRRFWPTAKPRRRGARPLAFWRASAG